MLHSCGQHLTPFKAGGLAPISACSMIPTELNVLEGKMPSPAQDCLPRSEDILHLDQQGIASILKRCISLSDGKRIHAQILKRNLQGDTFLGNLLIGMYRKCGAVEDARLVFDSMECRTVVSWNSMIAAYSHHGLGKEALDIYHRMEEDGVVPNRFTFISSLVACAILFSLEEGEAIHSRLVDIGLDSDTLVGTALLNLYVKCGTVENARSVFDRTHQCDVVSWTTMIIAYIQQGHGKEALSLFWEMQQQGVMPDQISFGSILGACNYPAALDEGRTIHASIVENGCKPDGILGTALVTMYQKCGALNDALSVFNAMQQKDVVCWTAMIMAYVEHGFGKEALNLYHLMQYQGVRPNQITIITILGSCATPDALPEGKAIHTSIMDAGFESDIVVRTALINMYGKCGACELARIVFDKEDQGDVVLWNAMISAYSQQGQCKMAFEIFGQLKHQGMEPDQVTFSSILGACTSPADLAEGKGIHATILASRFSSYIVVGNALVNMYSKCGSMEDACAAFEKMQERDVVSWNAMIASHCQHGHGKKALQVFKKMQEDGVKPDDVTFLCLLSACSHAGLLEEGRRLFLSLVEDHNVMPSLGHYCCMVDLLGRAGHLEDAENVIKEMPFEPDFVTWMTLLNACRMHDDVQRGERVAKHVFNMDLPNGETYILLSNIYATYGGQHGVDQANDGMCDEGENNLAECNWIGRVQLD